MGDPSPGLLNSMNGGEIGIFADDNYGQNNIAKSWMPAVIGFGSVQTPSACMWTPGSSSGPSNTHANGQALVPEYLGYGWKDSPILIIGPDDTLSYDVFDTCDSLTSNIFEMPDDPKPRFPTGQWTNLRHLRSGIWICQFQTRDT